MNLKKRCEIKFNENKLYVKTYRMYFFFRTRTPVMYILLKNFLTFKAVINFGRFPNC